MKKYVALFAQINSKRYKKQDTIIKQDTNYKIQ